jgi:hypothetical protein
MTLAEKRQKRGQLVQQMRALTDKADAAKRGLSAEEGQKEVGRAPQGAGEAPGRDPGREKESERRSRLTSLERDLDRTDHSGARPEPGGRQPRERRPG